MNDKDFIIRLAKRVAELEDALDAEKEASSYWYREYERLKHEPKPR